MASNRFRFPNQGASELNSFTSWNTISTGLNNARNNTRRLGAAFGEVQAAREGREETRYRQFTAGIGGMRGAIGGDAGLKVDAAITSYLKTLKSSGGHKIGNYELSKATADLQTKIESIASKLGGIQGDILKDFSKTLKDAKTAASKGGLAAISGSGKDAIKAAFGLKADNSIEDARKKIADEITQAAKSLSTQALRQSVTHVIEEMNRLSSAAKTSAEKQKILADAQTKLAEIRGGTTGADKAVMEDIVKSTHKTTSELNKDLLGQAANRKGLEFNNRLAALTNAIGIATRTLIPIKRTLDVGNALFQSVNSKFNQFARMQMRISAERGGFGRQVRGAGINYGHMMAAIGAGRSAGMEDRQVVGQMVGLQTQLAQARWGEGGLAENVGRWGISVYNGAGGVKQAHEVMIEFSRKLRSLGSDMEKLQFLHAIGRSPEEMEYVANYEKNAQRMEWLKRNPHMMGVLDRADILDASGFNAKADAATKIELRRREILNQNAIEQGPFEALKRSLNPENWLFSDWTARQKGVQQARGELAMERLTRAINEKIRQDEKNGKKSTDFSAIRAMLSPDDIAALAAAMQKDKDNGGEKSVAAAIEKDYELNYGIAFDTRGPIEKLSDAFAPAVDKFVKAVEDLTNWLANSSGGKKVIEGVAKGAEFTGEHPIAATGIGLAGLATLGLGWAGLKWGGKKFLGWGWRKLTSKFGKGKGGGPSGGAGGGLSAENAAKSPITPRGWQGNNSLFNNGEKYEILDQSRRFPTGKAANTAAKTGAKAAEKAAAESVGKAAVKAGAKVGAKGVGKSLAKKIPFLGWLPGLLFAGQRAAQGDWTGAGGELLSGVAGTIPGIGTGVSAAIDATLMGRDIYNSVNGGVGPAGIPANVNAASGAGVTTSTPNPEEERLISNKIATPTSKETTSSAREKGQELIESIRQLIKSNESLEKVQELLAKNKISTSLGAVKSDKFMTSNQFANQVLKAGEALNILEEYALKTGKAISWEEYSKKVNQNKYINAATRAGIGYSRSDAMVAASGKGTFSSAILENYMRNPLSKEELNQERYKVKSERPSLTEEEVDKEVNKRASRRLTQADYEKERDAIIEEQKALLKGRDATELVAERAEYERARESGAAKDGYFYGRLKDGSVGRLNDKGNWVYDSGNEVEDEQGNPIHVRDITDEDRKNRDRMMQILQKNPDITDVKTYEAAKLLSSSPEAQQEFALREMQKRGIDVSNRTEAQKFKSEQAAGFEKFRRENQHLGLAEAVSTYSYLTDIPEASVNDLVGYGKSDEELSEEELKARHKGAKYKAEDSKKRAEKRRADRKAEREAAAKEVTEEEAANYLGNEGQAAAYIRLRNRVEGGATLDEKEQKAYDKFTDIVGRKAGRAKSTAYKPLHELDPYKPDAEEQAVFAKSAELVKKQKADKNKPPLAQLSDVRYIGSLIERGGIADNDKELEKNFGKQRTRQFRKAQQDGSLEALNRGEHYKDDVGGKKKRRPQMTREEAEAAYRAMAETNVRRKEGESDEDYKKRVDEQVASNMELYDTLHPQKKGKGGNKGGAKPNATDAATSATGAMDNAQTQANQAAQKMATAGEGAAKAAASGNNIAGGGGGSTQKNITLNMGGYQITQNIQGEYSMDAEGMKKGTLQGATEINNESAQAVMLAIENRSIC